MRVRIRFQKVGKVRWTSHRDLARIWERAIRRVNLPVAYSQGFSPRPRLHFGLALSTGHESLAEYLDVDLVPDAANLPCEENLDVLVGPLSEALPVGIDVVALAEISTSVPSLQQAVTSCRWEIEVRGGTAEDVADHARSLGRKASTHAADVTDPETGEPYGLGLPVITWTVRTPEQVALTKAHADQMTFEGFLPQIT